MTYFDAKTRTGKLNHIVNDSYALTHCGRHAYGPRRQIKDRSGITCHRCKISLTPTIDTEPIPGTRSRYLGAQIWGPTSQGLRYRHRGTGHLFKPLRSRRGSLAL